MTKRLQSCSRVGRSPQTTSPPTAFSLAARPALSALSALALTGCMSMSGLSGSSNYACKAPEGVTCDSVSGTYANAVLNKLPNQRRATSTGLYTPAASRDVEGLANATGAAAMGGAAARIAVPPAPEATEAAMPKPTALPLRSSARILRLWFKPWEDADRDLHDQGYVYVRVDDGRWLVEHAQQEIREAYAPLRPPARGTGGAGTPGDAGPTARHPGPLQLPGLTPPAGRPKPPANASISD